MRGPVLNRKRLFSHTPQTGMAWGMPELEYGAQLPGPPPVVARSAQVSLPEATKAESDALWHTRSGIRARYAASVETAPTRAEAALFGQWFG